MSRSIYNDINFKKIYNLAGYNNLRITLVSSHKESCFKGFNNRRGVMYVPAPIFRALAQNKKREELFLAQNILHEMGHFVVAPRSRKYRKDYGIPVKKMGMFPSYWDIEDFKAQLVQIKLSELLGIKSFTSYNGVFKKCNYLFSRKRFWAKKWWTEIGEKQTVEFFKKKQLKNKTGLMIL